MSPPLPARPLIVGAYYLHDLTTRALLAGRDPAVVLDEVFDVARRAGAIGVRALACHVGVGPQAIQSGPIEVRELGLHALDVMLARAQRAGVGLILALGNSWNDYGGARAIVSMAGYRDATQADLRCFVSPRARRVFRFGMRAVLERRSRIDGHMLATHPAVLGWEPMNEPRAKRLDGGGRAMRWWLDGVLEEIAERAPDKLLSSGEEGLDVSTANRDVRFWRSVRGLHLFRHHHSFALNAQSRRATHASIHVYPDAWGVPRTRIGEVGEHFIRESARLAEDKPLFVGEMGAVGPERFALLARWCRVTWALGGIAGVWMLASPHAPDLRDHYAIEPEDFVRWARAIR